MTMSSKPAKQTRRNKNRHFRSKLNPKVMGLIATLRNGWADLGRVERGQRINKLVSVGCSKRGLGNDLGIPEASLRRDAKIAELPESNRKAIDCGQSAKEILNAKNRTTLEREMRRRVDQDARRGALSDEIASIILEFCRTGHQLRKQRIIKPMFQTFLDNVGSYLRKFEQTDRRTHKVAQKLESSKLFRKTRPRAGKDAPYMVHQAEWLAEALWLIAPESPIMASALIKARKRAGELLPKRTPSESFSEGYLVSLAKSIERSNLNRRVPQGGARYLMQRQGPASLTHPSGWKNRDSKA